jgi:hypothetical protein
VDWDVYADNALKSFAEATTSGELAAAHTAALGRKSELKTALREVRDRETGMTLNAVRVRLEEAFEDRESELERAELDRRLSDDAFDVTVPGDEIAVGQLHPTTQVRRLVEDTFLGRATRSATTARSRPRSTTRQTASSRLIRAGHRDVLPGRRHGPAHGDVSVADPLDGGEAAADLHGLHRPLLPPGRD